MHEGQPVLAERGRDLEPISELFSPELVGKVYRQHNPDPENPRTPPAGEDLRDWFDDAVASRQPKDGTVH